MVDLLKENHRRLFSGNKMERNNKRSELLSPIQEYGLVKEEELMFYVRMGMEEVKSTCHKWSQAKKLRVLLSELPVTRTFGLYKVVDESTPM